MLDNTEPDAAAAPELPASPRALRGCVFVLGDAPYAIDVRDAREVVVLESCAHVPGGPQHLAGVTNVRGSIVPVVEIRPLLGLPARPVTTGTMAVIVAAGAYRAAVPIDRVLGLESFEGVLAVDAQHAAAPPFVTGFLSRGAERFTLLDTGRILTALRSWAQEEG